MRYALLLGFVVCCSVSFSATTEHGDLDLTTIDRTIAKEPSYQFQPHYGLVVFGPQADHRSWLVMDGNEILYFDRNGNGDLTEPEDRIELDVEATSQINVGEDSGYTGMNVFPIGGVSDVQLSFQLWARKKNFISPDERIRRIQEERRANNWENGTLWRISADGSHSQNGINLTNNPEDAQITHLNGPLTFKLKWGEQQKLQPWPKLTVFDIHIGTPSLAARNFKHQVFSPLAESEIPRDVHPIAIFEFPPKIAGGESIVREVPLDERCCGDTALAQFTLPREAGSGTAKVSLTYPAWKERVVNPKSFEVPIEEGMSERSEVSFVMFDDENRQINLDIIQGALENKGFQCRRYTQDKTDAIVIDLGNGEDSTSALAIILERGDQVEETASALGEGSPHEATLSECDARLAIHYSELEKTLANAEAFATFQSALQKATEGIIYNSWNKELTGPK